MKVAVAQVSSGPDVEANLRTVSEWTVRSAEQGADVVVFPEAMVSWFALPPHDAVAVAERWVETVGELASDLDITVMTGMFTEVDEESDRVRNTLLVTDGTASSVYHKRHAYDALGYQESLTVDPGDELLVTPVAGVPAGFAICYDLRFPEHVKQLAWAGAQVIYVVASWGDGPGKADMWRTLVRARAMDSTCFVVACDQAVPEPWPAGVDRATPLGVGGSMVVGPLGEVLAEARTGPKLLVVDLDLGLVDKARASMPVLANSRR